MEENKEIIKENKKGSSLFDFASIVMTGIVAIAVVFTFFFRTATVSGRSMQPTLNGGDMLMVTAFDNTHERGDIVVITQPNAFNEPIIKRIIAVGGDKVDINFTTGVVTVNGQEEEYTDSLTLQQFDIAFPITVPEGCVFVLGDNRAESLDSRSTEIGCIDERFIVGKVLFRLFPLGEGKVE